MEANVIICKCRNGNMFGWRVEKRGGDWVRTWAFPISPESARREGYDAVSINGSFDAVDDYPGCPYCGGGGFFVCSCGKINCWNGQTNATCTWCGKNCSIRVAENFNLTGGGH